jgi:SAM-dependent methyltransferase
MPCENRLLRRQLSLLATLALAMVAAQYASAQSLRGQDRVATLSAVDLATLVTRCGGAEPQDDSLELFKNPACSPRRFQAGQIIAFEENKRFVYALAEMPPGSAGEGGSRPQQALRWFRRVFLLKPSTLIVEDMASPPPPDVSLRWILQSTAEPMIEANRFRVAEANTEIVGETVLPADATLKEITRPSRDDRPVTFQVEVDATQETDDPRFLHVFRVDPSAGSDGATGAKIAGTDKTVELKIADQEKVFRLTLPTEGVIAGTIEITAADGTALLPKRLLPSGVMPHGPKGTELMERWDAPYRRERLPGWDVGRPCSHLVKAVEDKTFKPGRAIVFGCGSGTNAIYLASKGFEVTGVDVSPTALSIAAEKARKANVEVNWMLADVVSLPKLQPYDLIFDRGCYHHICQYDSPGYVDAIRRLSHAGTRAMILAGSPADGNSGGPPRIKEATIRNDFSKLFHFDWLRGIQFDSSNPDAKGPSAWSIHLRRKDE